MLDVCESVYVIEKLRLVRSGQFFGAFGSWYAVGKRLVITIWSCGQIRVGISRGRRADYKR